MMKSTDRMKSAWLHSSAGAALLGSLFVLGCSQSTTSSAGFDVQEPRVTQGGVILEPDEPARDDALAKMSPAIASVVANLGGDRTKLGISILREIRDLMGEG